MNNTRARLIRRAGRPTWTVPQADITLTATPSRTSGIAPLGTTIDCVATTSGETAEPFHDILYKHVVTGGDLGNWTYGLRAGMSRNIAYGPVASFVFKEAGTWTITTTPYINNRAGTAIANVITVTAADDAAEFATTKTIYASPNGVFPAEVAANGWTTTTESDFRLLVAMLTQTTRKRLILDGTQNFTVTAPRSRAWRPLARSGLARIPMEHQPSRRLARGRPGEAAPLPAGRYSDSPLLPPLMCARRRANTPATFASLA
jgi:hypothetical protein